MRTRIIIKLLQAIQRGFIFKPGEYIIKISTWIDATPNNGQSEIKGQFQVIWEDWMNKSEESSSFFKERIEWILVWAKEKKIVISSIQNFLVKCLSN